MASTTPTAYIIMKRGPQCIYFGDPAVEHPYLVYSDRKAAASKLKELTKKARDCDYWLVCRKLRSC